MNGNWMGRIYQLWREGGAREFSNPFQDTLFISIFHLSFSFFFFSHPSRLSMDCSFAALSVFMLPTLCIWVVPLFCKEGKGWLWVLCCASAFLCGKGRQPFMSREFFFRIVSVSVSVLIRALSYSSRRFYSIPPWTYGLGWGVYLPWK